MQLGLLSLLEVKQEVSSLLALGAWACLGPSCVSRPPPGSRRTLPQSNDPDMSIR